jgi:Tfp pilus assembly protein PilO
MTIDLGAARVPLARIATEHRRWLWPLGIVLVANVVLLVGGVLPLARASATADRRAQNARQALTTAEADFRQAEATRGGQSLATEELKTFYGEVLPKNLAAARRITHVKLAELAKSHGVSYDRMAASPENERSSTLERLSVNVELSGDYGDIRAFLHDLETSPDFIVIDNILLSEGGQDQAPLELTLQLSTYYLAAPHGS